MIKGFFSLPELSAFILLKAVRMACGYRRMQREIRNGGASPALEGNLIFIIWKGANRRCISMSA